MQQTSIGQCITLLAFLALGACGPDAGPPAPGGGVAEPAQVTEPADDDSAFTPPAPGRSTAPDGARVFFIAPEDGAVASSPVEVRFGVEGMEVMPAGQAAPHSGHHHVLVDTGLPALGLPVPADARHIHFGDGRSSTALALKPGEHTLQLLFADHLHLPHDPPIYSEPITITVE